jgi:hypothetical protein
MLERPSEYTEPALAALHQELTGRGIDPGVAAARVAAEREARASQARAAARELESLAASSLAADVCLACRQAAPRPGEPDRAAAARAPGTGQPRLLVHRCLAARGRDRAHRKPDPRQERQPC